LTGQSHLIPVLKRFVFPPFSGIYWKEQRRGIFANFFEQLLKKRRQIEPSSHLVNKSLDNFQK